MLPNKVFALECRKKYEEQGLIVDKRNGQFAHCPLPKGMGDEGLYLLWGDHQHQGLLQSRDVGRRCFYAYEVKRWLDTFPEGFFELYEIYDEFISGEHGSRFGVPHTEEWKKAHSERMSGENHPQYGRTGALHHNSKTIIAIKPDGTQLHFESITEAERELGIAHGHLSSRYLKPGKQPKQGKWAGWRFFYKNSEVLV